MGFMCSVQLQELLTAYFPWFKKLGEIASRGIELPTVVEVTTGEANQIPHFGPGPAC